MLPTTPDHAASVSPAAFAEALEAWLATRPPAVLAAAEHVADYPTRIRIMQDLMQVLWDEGFVRYGWPAEVGGLGGSFLHRAAMWEGLARHGVLGMNLFEHLEVLLPTLVELGPLPFTSEHVPLYLSGREIWSQGFSEPGAGSDLAALRTKAVPDGDGYRISGQKIWTSWSVWAQWCCVLARTGTTESRHRGITAFIVDLRDPGVEVRGIWQANGNEELAEVFFDDVFVPADRIVGELDGGWRVAMHILSHERGTFAWFRHNFLYQQLIEFGASSPDAPEFLLGDALLDLVAATACSANGVKAHAAGEILGPRACTNKLMLCTAEQSVQDAILAGDVDLAIGVQDELTDLLRQEYLFSRIVTVYGGSQQMQLETIAKQVLQLP
jgi:alkylation response protein AidB-like acyl-CoA dehydrogenase